MTPNEYPRYMPAMMWYIMHVPNIIVLYNWFNKLLSVWDSASRTYEYVYIRMNVSLYGHMPPEPFLNCEFSCTIRTKSGKKLSSPVVAHAFLFIIIINNQYPTFF